MGAYAASVYTGAMPDKVDKLIMIDLIKGIHVEPKNQPSRMAKYLEEVFDYEKKLFTKPPTYTYEEMVERMIKSYGGTLTEESAKTLLIRGSEKQEDGRYSFNYDPVVKLNNIFSMSFEQQKAFASQIKCEMLIIKASLGPLYENKTFYKEILKIYDASSSKFLYKIVEGNHHVHLNDPTECSSLINDFLEGKLEKSSEEDISQL